MKIRTIFVLLALAIPVAAQNDYTTTPNLNLKKPKLGSTNYATYVNQDLDILDQAASAVGGICRVPTSQYATIQAALDAACPYVWVSPNYVGPNETSIGNGQSVMDFRGGTVQIRGSLSVTQTNNNAPIQIGSTWFPGVASGLVTPPALTPTLASESSSNILGTLSNGTYYCVYTYANRNGETLQSPQGSVTLSGGTSTQKFYARLSDYGWITGAYKFRLYCGTASGGPYYLQTPANVRSAVANNGFVRSSNVVTVTFSGNHPFRKGQSVTFTGASGCGTSVNSSFTVTDVPSATTLTFAQTAGDETCGGASAVGYYNPALTNDANAIYAGVLGLADFIVDTLAVSGTQPPAANTATIDPLQVAVNRLHNLSGGTFTLRQGSVQLLATTYTLTTPLVCYECVLSGHSMSFQEQASYTGTLITSTWNDNDLGTVMVMGPQPRFRWLGITASGTNTNALMFVGGTTNMNGSDFAGVFAAPNASGEGAGIRIHRVNVSQNHIWQNVTANGGRKAVFITNASFGPWSWDGGRTNCSGIFNDSSALAHWAGPVDVSRGAKIASDSIPSTVALTWGDNDIHATESCKGIVVDFGGGLLRIGRRWNNADGAHPAGTEAIVKLWSDNWSKGNSVSGFQNEGTILGSGNVLATVKMGPGASDYGLRNKNTLNGFVGGSTGSGTNICVDFNNQAVSLAQENTFAASACSPDPNADSSNGIYANVPAGAVTALMSQNANGKDSSTGVSRGWSEFLDRLLIRQSLRSRAFLYDIDESSPFNLRLYSGLTPSGTPIMELFATGNNVKIGGGLRLGANPADASFGSANIVGVPNNLWFMARNSANSADVNSWRVNSADRFEFCGTNCSGITTNATFFSTVSTQGQQHIPQVQLVYKTADESVTSSTTLQNDDELVVTLTGGTTYKFKFFLLTNNAGNAEGIKLALDGTATITNLRAQFLVYAQAAAIASNGIITAFAVPASANPCPSTSCDQLAVIEGTIEVNAGGTFRLTWAQQSSGASATTIKRGSYLEAIRMK